MHPIGAWVLGMFFSELMQWGLWITAHPGKPKHGYLEDGLPHFLSAWSVCGGVCTLWALGGLDQLMAMLPAGFLGDFWKAGVPYTPQVGLITAFGLDFMADKVAFAVRARFGNGAPPAPSLEPPPG